MKAIKPPARIRATNSPTSEENSPVHREQNREIAAYLACFDLVCTGYDGSAYIFSDPEGVARILAEDYREDIIAPVESARLHREKLRLVQMARDSKPGLTADAPKLTRKRPSAKPGKQTKDATKPIRAVIDVIGGTRGQSGELQSRIPRHYFGTDKARILRKLVLVAIAASANADGSDAWPSLQTLAERCLVSVRAVQDIVDWLEERGLILRESKAVPVPGKKTHTNRYHIVFPDLWTTGDETSC